MACQIIEAANAASKGGGSLPDPVYQALLTALDDEYKAEATYAAIIALHGEIRPFSNIIQAERRHAAAIAKVLKSHGHHVPENGYKSGALSLPAAPSDVKNACAIAVEAEEDNIRLYNEELLPVVSEFPEISALFRKLRDSSEQRHLPAFQRCFARRSGQRMESHK